MTDTTNYRLHFAIRSTDNDIHLFYIDGLTAARIAIGSSSFNDGGIITQAFCDFPRDGQWHEIEIPLSKLIERGLSYRRDMGTKNVLCILSGGITGKSFDLDAVFFYRKTVASTGITESHSENSFTVKDKIIYSTAPGEPLELFNLMGQKIISTNETCINVHNIKAGIYIIRSGKKTMKIQL